MANKKLNKTDELEKEENSIEENLEKEESEKEENLEKEKEINNNLPNTGSKEKKYQVMDSSLWGKEIFTAKGKYKIGKDGFISLETKEAIEPFFSIATSV